MCDSVSGWWLKSISPDTENWWCYTQCLRSVRLAQHKCDQFYFCSDAKHRKLSQSQHVVVLRHLLSAVSPLAHHISNSWLIYKWRELGTKKKNCFSTFCAYKAWWRMERREYTKVIMSPLFSDEKVIWNCPDFFYKETRHQGCMFALSPQNVLSQPRNQRKKWFFFSSVSVSLTLSLSLGNSRRCVRPPAAVYQLNCLQSSPGDAFMEDLSELTTRTNTDVCLFVQQSAESVRWIFIKKSYLKWNLSRAACGKHCHVRETAKPYKAFPPKGST